MSAPSLPIAARGLDDQRRTLPAWAGGLVLLIVIYAAVWPSLRGNAGYANLLDELPKAYKALFTTGGADLTTPAGYLGTELFSFVGPLVVILFAVLGGGNAIAGEEERGTLEWLLALPVTRSRLLLERALATLAGVAALMLVTFAALWPVTTVVSMNLPVSHLAAGALLLGLLGVEFGALALLVGAATGRPGVAKAVAGLAALAAYVLYGLGSIVTALSGVRKLSPFYAYAGQDPLSHGLPWAHVGVLVVPTVVMVAAAAWAFGRRDVGT